MAGKGDGEQVLTDCWGEREPGFLSLLPSTREKKSLFAHFSAPFKMFPLRILEQLCSNLEHGWNARLAGGTILEKSEDGSGGNLEQTRQFQPPSNNFLPFPTSSTLIKRISLSQFIKGLGHPPTMSTQAVSTQTSVKESLE